MSVEKCQGCAYLNPIMFHCGKYLRGIETAVYLCDTAKPQTNADRIRAMTDEELAEWITELTDYAVYPHTRKDAPCISIGQTCTASWLEWLKQEASE